MNSTLIERGAIAILAVISVVWLIVFIAITDKYRNLDVSTNSWVESLCKFSDPVVHTKETGNFTFYSVTASIVNLESAAYLRAQLTPYSSLRDFQYWIQMYWMTDLDRCNVMSCGDYCDDDYSSGGSSVPSSYVPNEEYSPSVDIPPSFLPQESRIVVCYFIPSKPVSSITIWASDIEAYEQARLSTRRETYSLSVASLCLWVFGIVAIAGVALRRILKENGSCCDGENGREDHGTNTTTGTTTVQLSASLVQNDYMS